MAKQGMDIEQIRNDGTQMKNVGDQAIPQVIASIDGIVDQLQGTWWGPDSQTFVNNWTSTFKPHLTTIAQAVSSHGQTALTNAQDQEQTSSGAGSAGAQTA